MRHTDTQTFDPSTSRSFLVDALRATSERLEKEDTKYQWGHMGQCNAGHLIQTVTGMDSFEIVQSVDFQLDEWSQQTARFISGVRFVEPHSRKVGQIGQQPKVFLIDVVLRERNSVYRVFFRRTQSYIGDIELSTGLFLFLLGDWLSECRAVGSTVPLDLLS